jgi:integrase
MASSGVYQRHLKTCPQVGACKCPWEAKWWNRHANKRESKRGFRTKSEAAAYRREKLTAIDKGTHRTPSKKTVAEACEELVAGMRDGSILTRKGKRYRYDTIVQYERNLRLRVIPTIGRYRLADLDRPAVQRFVDQLMKNQESSEVIAVTMTPLKVIYRRAIHRGEIHAADPTRGLEMPRQFGKRERIANEHEAAQLIAAVPECDQAVWAAAFYAGLRRGELQGLTWDRIDTSGAVPYIVVDRSWNGRLKSFGDTKTATSHRRVPVLDALKPFLQMQWERTDGTGFVFPLSSIVYRTWPSHDRLLAMVDELGHEETGNRLGCPRGTVTARVMRIRRGVALTRPTGGEVPFIYTPFRKRALSAWKRAGLEPILLHECRHTFASMMFARRVNPVQIQHWMGHSNLQLTLKIYTHLIPDSEEAEIERANQPLALRVIEGGRREIESGPARQSRDSFPA